MAEVLEAHTLREAAALFASAGLATAGTILTESYISLAALICVFGITLGLCRSGGIGALPGEGLVQGAGAGHAAPIWCRHGSCRCNSAARA